MEVGREVETGEGKEACSVKQGDREALGISALDTPYPNLRSPNRFYSHSDYKHKKTPKRFKTKSSIEIIKASFHPS